jgi:hypothetical protein
MNAPIARRANGTVLPGTILNAGGRPKTAIEELRARYLPRLSEFFNGLIELSKSENETTRLSAVREILDRLLGKPAVFVDATHTTVDIPSLYLQALISKARGPDRPSLHCSHMPRRRSLSCPCWKSSPGCTSSPI